jgi:ADP-heptose:LPS heptosyltransferase
LTDRTEIWSASHPHYQLFSAGLAPASILVCKLDHVGDFCLAFEALFALRRAYPASQLVLACAPWNVAIAQALGVFDQVVGVQFFPARADDAPLPFDPARLGPLAEMTFDMAIDLRLDPDTRVVFDHLRAAATFGYESDRCARPLTVAIPLPHASIDGNDLLQHQSLLMLRLVESILALIRPPTAMRAALRERLINGGPGAALAGLPRPIVGVCTGSGRKAKDWPAPRFQEIVRWLCDDIGTSVVLLGTEGQAPDARLIQKACPSPRLRSLVGETSLLDALKVVGNTDLFVGNDTSLTHYAARFGVPTIGLFSGIDPTAVWVPVGEHATVLKAPVACSPCHILHLEHCVNNHACMIDIPVTAVKRVIRRTLLKVAAPNQAVVPATRPKADAPAA